uniref:Uncharacterized protein n=1 Tax=Sus scrofa TaxID=9823 RepID=A0A4X1UJ07_PIG
FNSWLAINNYPAALALSCLTVPPLPQLSNTCCKEKTLTSLRSPEGTVLPPGPTWSWESELQTGRAQVWPEASLVVKPLQSVLTPPLTSLLGLIRALMMGEMTQNPTGPLGSVPFD